MLITYWGVRGTIATPGSSTIRYGGNTSCVSVEIGDSVIVLDAGTGARKLGAELLGRGKRIIMCFSHRHFDHISGFPYFAPLHDPNQDMIVGGVRRPDGSIWYPTEMLDGAFFPKHYNELPSRSELVDLDAYDWIGEFGVEFEQFSVCHPGGAVGFRIRCGNEVFVHVPDNELGRSAEIDDRVESICRSATILSHDSQYTDGEMTAKAGWGHSTARQTCELAQRAGVNEVVLFHHDPTRTDDELDTMSAELNQTFAPLNCQMAYEGLVLEI